MVFLLHGSECRLLGSNFWSMQPGLGSRGKNLGSRGKEFREVVCDGLSIQVLGIEVSRKTDL